MKKILEMSKKDKAEVTKVENKTDEVKKKISFLQQLDEVSI